MFSRFVLLIALAISAAAQTSKPYQAPRLADGHPDLQGTYDLATLTPLERPAGSSAVLTPEEAAKREKQTAAQRDKANEAIRGDRPAPPKAATDPSGPPEPSAATTYSGSTPARNSPSSMDRFAPAS